MYLHDRLAVFQRIGLLNRFTRQLALFADRHKSFAKLVGNCTTKDKATCFKPDHLVDVHAGVGVQQLINRNPKPAWIRKQRGHIAKHDPRVREIGDRTDIVLDSFHSSGLSKGAAGNGVEFGNQVWIAFVRRCHDRVG